ncbi:MAG: LPS export ABC transporter ATP-binding protein [Planctomycetota bacterium]
MLLKVENLVKIYSNRRVVDGVSFDIKPGEIVGLLGRNGAGKTTTFKMTVGLVIPNDGRVYLNDQEITRLPMYQRARYGMGYLSQEPSIFQRLTVEENLLAILETLRLSKAERESEARRLLEEYGLLRLAKQLACTLSGGEMRRLEISRALITSPRLMLLDEPFSGVDPIAVSEIKEIIRGLKSKNIGVLLTDHNVKETLSVTDRSYIIDEGKILSSGTPVEIMNDPLARKKYLGEKFTM